MSPEIKDKVPQSSIYDVYIDAESRAIFTLPGFPETERVLEEGREYRARVFWR